VPIPIQSASLTERLRKFFRIRGKTAFALDEIVAPVVVVQDLTVGPYQSGVTPAAGTETVIPATGDTFAFAVMMNDKPGSPTPVLPNQFNNRSFSFSWIDLQNVDIPAPTGLEEIELSLAPRSTIVAQAAAQSGSNLVSIQGNDGSITVPVEIFGFAQPTVVTPRTRIWQGILGDNTNVLGSRRTLEDIKPNITIGPEDALIVQATASLTQPIVLGIYLSVRGFYQEQPA